MGEGIIIACFSLFIVIGIVCWFGTRWLLNSVSKKNPDAVRLAQRRTAGVFKWYGKQFMDGYHDGRQR